MILKVLDKIKGLKGFKASVRFFIKTFQSFKASLKNHVSKGFCFLGFSNSFRVFENQGAKVFLSFFKEVIFKDQGFHAIFKENIYIFRVSEGRDGFTD